MLKLYNTLTRKKQVFKTLKSKKAGVYSCGPTVYWNQHIGNMYAYIHWDVLVRFLKQQGHRVKWVMNITDVGHMTSDEDSGEDKIEKGARREKLTVWQIADKYTGQFLQSMDKLNINRPDILCRATDHIKEQIDLIKKIEKNGFTYKTKTGLVFNTAKFKDYARFARLKLEHQQAGARVAVDEEKKHLWDFLLWVTNQPNHVMQWDSPWGKGFPGWHLECTAMSTKYLGKKFDIHTGGVEHIPVHHTNEVAQGYAAFGRQTAVYWLHNQWLKIANEKVSKSLGNIILVHDFIEKGINPLAFRYLVLTSHYRQGLNFTWKSLQSAEIALKSLYEKTLELREKDKKTGSIKAGQFEKKFTQALNDDLNGPKALAVLWQTIKSRQLNNKDKYELVLKFDRVLGLGLKDLKKQIVPERIKKLSAQREKYRQNKQWQKADEIRKKIESSGYKIKDTIRGAVISRQ